MLPNIRTASAISNILRHPHGRRMLCGMLTVSPDERWPEHFFDEIAKLPPAEQEETRRFLSCAPWLDSAAAGRLSAKMVSSFNAKDSAFEFFSDLATMMNSGDEYRGVDIYDLASPVINGACIKDLLANKEITPAAKSALMANRNLPAEFADTSIPDWNAFLLASAKHGDLKAPNTSRRVTNQFIKGGCKNAGMVDKALGFLVVREDLPDDLIAGLEEIVSETDYRTLSRTSAYDAYFQKNRASLSESEKVLRKPFIHLPPGIAPEALDTAATLLETAPWRERVGDWTTAMAQIASHPNAKWSLMETALHYPPVRGKLGIVSPLSDSPHAAPAIRYMYQESRLSRLQEKLFAEMARIPDCSAENLAWAFDMARDQARRISIPAGRIKDAEAKDECISLASHQNFPWEKYSKEIKDTFLPADYGMVAIAIHLAEKSNLPQLEPFTGKAYLAESLFSQKLSSVKLEKLAIAHPNLAPFCAIHPNGNDVKAPETTWHQEIMPRLKKFLSASPAISLSGRCTNQPDHPPRQLLI